MLENLTILHQFCIIGSKIDLGSLASKLKLMAHQVLALTWSGPISSENESFTPAVRGRTMLGSR